MLRRLEMVMGPHDKAERFKRSLVGLQEQRSRMYWPVAPFRDKSQKPENKFVVLYVDNISLIYAWEKKYCKNDEETSILIRCLHVLESFLEAKVFVEHVKRMSNDMAVLVDHLSRDSSTTDQDLERIRSVPRLSPSMSLAAWIEKPCLDWNMPNKLITDVDSMLKE